MILYDSSVAPKPRRVRIFLAEKGVEVPSQQIEIGRAENRKSPCVDKNPLAGPRDTIADITALCAIDLGCLTEIRLGPELKNPSRWHEGVSSRPSAKAWARLTGRTPGCRGGGDTGCWIGRL